MAKDISVLIGGNASKAEKALQHLRATGRDVTDDMGKDFAKLGTKADSAFNKKRQSATEAYGRISQSGKASAGEIARAEQALGNQLVKIDQEQFGKRRSMLEKFKVGWMGAAAAMGTAYAAINFGKKAVEEFKQFETALVDMGKVTSEPLDQIKKKIMDLPAALGSATQLVEGYYQVISAGVTEPVAAMDLLKVAAMGAKAAHIDQGEMIKALTKLMAGFSGEIKNSTEASDLLFNIERYGQTTVAELAPVIGNLASISNQLRVMPTEMAAFVATLTQTAGSTAQAATQYEAILTGFLKPTSTMLEMIKRVGYESGQQLIGDKGLVGALQMVKTAAEEGGVGFSKLFESKEALIGLGPMMANGFAGVNKTIQDIKTSAGATDQAFKDWEATLDATKEIFDNTINKVMIELGEDLAPMVNKAMLAFSDWVTTNRSEINTFFGGLASFIGGVVTAAGSLYNVVSDLVSIFSSAAAETSLFFGNQADAGQANWQNFDGGDLTGSGSAPVRKSADPNAPFGTYSSGSYHTGTGFVPRSGMYNLARGEQVLNRQEAKQGQGGQAQGSSMSFGDINLSFPNITDKSTSRELARDLYPQLKALGMRFA